MKQQNYSKKPTTGKYRITNYNVGRNLVWWWFYVVNDRNNNPIGVEVKSFMKLILDTYVQEQNRALAEQRKIVTARSVEEILTYDD